MDTAAGLGIRPGPLSRWVVLKSTGVYGIELYVEKLYAYCMQNNFTLSRREPVFEKLLADLISCAIVPGTQIQEVQAAARYGTSRTKLREAFVDLSARGFVHLEKNKGAVASPMDASTVYSVFEARIAAEKAAAALAAVRVTPDESANLREFEKELQQARSSEDLDSFFAVDRAVHDAIATYSRNPLIAAQVQIMRAHTARCWHFYRDRGLTERADYSGVSAILTAVATGQPKDAAEAMHLHLSTYLAAFNEMLSNQFEALKWV